MNRRLKSNSPLISDVAGIVRMFLASRLHSLMQFLSSSVPCKYKAEGIPLPKIFF
jgi:hypothetical protein